MDTDDLETLLIKLREEHRDLDDAVAALGVPTNINQLQLQRLKRKKLMLKDKISKIENKLLPDIIA
jgi:hypothetical protein